MSLLQPPKKKKRKSCGLPIQIISDTGGKVKESDNRTLSDDFNDCITDIDDQEDITDTHALILFLKEKFPTSHFFNQAVVSRSQLYFEMGDENTKVDIEVKVLIRSGVVRLFSLSSNAIDDVFMLSDDYKRMISHSREIFTQKHEMWKNKHKISQNGLLHLYLKIVLNICCNPFLITDFYV